MRNGFIFYRSFYEAIKDAPKKTKLEIFEAACEYCLNGNDVQLTGISKTIFVLIKPQLDANNRRFENGGKQKNKQDGSKPEAKPKQDGSKPEAKPKQDGSKPEAKDKEKEKDKENEKEKDGIIFPFFSDEFFQAWARWIRYRQDIKKPYKSDLSIQGALNELKKFSEADAIRAIDYSISKAWQGIFAENNHSITAVVQSNHPKPQDRDDSW